MKWLQIMPYRELIISFLLGISNLSIYILIKLWSSWLYVCLFEAVRTNPGYGMAALISNNLLNLILGTVILLRSS